VSWTACRFRTSLRANGEHTDDAEVLRLTPPPAAPLHKGGKRRLRVRNKNAPLAFDSSAPSNPKLHRASACLPASCGFFRFVRCEASGEPRHYSVRKEPRLLANVSALANTCTPGEVFILWSRSQPGLLARSQCHVKVVGTGRDLLRPRPTLCLDPQPNLLIGDISKVESTLSIGARHDAPDVVD
jgi:hypothetical protein